MALQQHRLEPDNCGDAAGTARHLACMFAAGAMGMGWMDLNLVAVPGEKVIPSNGPFGKARGSAFAAVQLWRSPGT
jgi:hypothetical protein